MLCQWTPTKVFSIVMQKVLLTDSDAVIAIYSKCSSTMKVAKCATHNVASVMLQDDQNKMHSVTSFNDILKQIISYSKQDNIT